MLTNDSLLFAIADKFDVVDLNIPVGSLVSYLEFESHLCFIEETRMKIRAIIDFKESKPQIINSLHVPIKYIAH